jgi:hypothetical protein
VPWIWTTLQFVGLCVLVGAITVLDLRMIGVAENLPIAAFQQLAWWGAAGCATSLIIGLLFLMGAAHPFRYHAGLFTILTVMGGLNISYFYVCGVFEKAKAPAYVKVVCWMSIFVWMGLIYWLRFLGWAG